MKTPRYEVGMDFCEMFPVRDDGICACGCNEPLTGRRTRWATKECSKRAGDEFAFAKGDVEVVRRFVWMRDAGLCAHCKTDGVPWEADHVTELADGGTRELSNLQTLCVPCHRTKTRESARARRDRKRAQSVHKRQPDGNEAIDDPARAEPRERARANRTARGSAGR